MSSRRYHSSTWRPLVITVGLLLFNGSLYSAFGQRLPGETDSGYRPPAPQTYVKHNPSGNQPVSRSKRTTNNPPQPDAREEEKQKAFAQFIMDGNKEREANKYEQAFDHYRKAEGLNRNDERAPYGIASLYYDLYCYDSAIDAYLDALKFKKDYLEAVIGLGYAYSGKERYEDAEKQFQEALKLKPDSAEANIGLGRIYLMKGKYQEAITQINLVINSKSAEDKDRAAAYVALGDVYWKQEKKQDAIAQFEEAIRLKPELAAAYIELGNAKAAIAFSKLGGFPNVNEVSMQELEALRESEKQALAILEDAGKKHNYNHPNLHEYMAISLAYQFRYEDALSQLDDYFSEIKKLEDGISPQVMKCNAGFDHLKADGYQYRGIVYSLESHSEPDTRRQNEFLDKALEQFNQAIKAKEDYVSAYMMIGGIYAGQKKNEDAIANYKKALLFATDESVKASLYQSIGLSYDTLGRHDDAFDNVQEAIKRNPNNPSFYESLALIYVGQGKLEETIAQLKKSNDLRVELKIESAANPYPYYYLGSAYTIRFIRGKNEEDFNNAIKALKEVIRIRPKMAFAYQALGMVYEYHSDIDQALANFQKASECDPKNPEFYYNMAWVYYYFKNNNDAAIGLLKQAIGLKQDYGIARWLLGEAYHHKKDDTEAIKQFQDAIKYEPKFLASYRDLAYIYRIQKNYPEAIKILTSAIEIAPTNPEPYQQMGLVYLESSNADQALANFNKAIEYGPKNPVYYSNMAAVYFKMKHDSEAAIKQLLKAIEVDPKYLDAYSSLAEIYKERKNYSEAIKSLTTTIGIAPQVPWAYKDLAKVYEAQGKNNDAVHYYEEAMNRLDANDSSTKNLYLGRIARLKGQYAEAIGYFQKVSYPDEPGQAYFEIGMTYIVSKNKRAAQEQYQQLVQLKSSLAEELLKKINEMK
jgi:tetratricopeptide (TPR) repeat protein